MENIIEYSKGKDSLEKREKYINDLISKLDKESYELYSDIIDCSNTSYYQLPNLALRCNELTNLFKEVLSAYEYLNNVSENNVMSATRRFQLKRMLTLIATVYAFYANALLGIASFVLLNSKASKDFYNELVDIESLYTNFDEEKIIKIEATLKNCSRIFNKKLERMKTNTKELKNDEDSINILAANTYIHYYINDEIGKEVFEYLPVSIKNEIVFLLKNDLNSDSNDLYELLDLVKNKDNNSLKLIKEYKKTRNS